jgi:hypothetical protein
MNEDLIMMPNQLFYQLLVVALVKRHDASGCVPNQTLQLITPMRWNPNIGVQGKAVHIGTAGSCEFRAFPFIAQARADAVHFLPGTFSKGDALLDR